MCRVSLAGYLKEKGKNLATTEDISELSKQTAILTEAAKTIEASISDRVWDRQKRWELKRDALIGSITALDRVDDALLKMATAYANCRHRDQEAKESWNGLARDTQEAWLVEANSYDERCAVCDLVCQGETTRALRAARQEIRQSASKLFKGEMNSYSDMSLAIQSKRSAVLTAARMELGVDARLA